MSLITVATMAFDAVETPFEKQTKLWAALPLMPLMLQASLQNLFSRYQ